MKRLKNKCSVRFADRDTKKMIDTVDLWYLVNRPIVTWWRIPSIERVRKRVVFILNLKIGSIILDGLTGEKKRYTDSASVDKRTAEVYGDMYNKDHELVSRFLGLEQRELRKAEKVEKLIEKIRISGIPRDVLKYVPEITFFVV